MPKFTSGPFSSGCGGLKRLNLRSAEHNLSFEDSCVPWFSSNNLCKLLVAMIAKIPLE